MNKTKNNSKIKEKRVIISLTEAEKIELDRLANRFKLKPSRLAYLSLLKVLKLSSNEAWFLDLHRSVVKSLVMSVLDEIKELIVAEKNDCYWDIQQLAEYLSVSQATLHRHLIYDPRFPKPVVLHSQKGKRWLASECKKALLLFKQ